MRREKLMKTLQSDGKYYSVFKLRDNIAEEGSIKAYFNSGRRESLWVIRALTLPFPESLTIFLVETVSSDVKGLPKFRYGVQLTTCVADYPELDEQ